MSNQEMQILSQPLFKTQKYFGDFDPDKEGGYDTKNQVSLFGAVFESKRDNNTTAPAVWDGGDTITVNTEDWKQVMGDYEAWLMNKDKPATTGTTGDYPYNGMGRIVLKKNMQNIAAEGEPEKIVNVLTQGAFEDGEGNPVTNSIFVIKYDFVLSEDITIPDNCVLEFQGGSVSGESIDLNNADIVAPLKPVFKGTALSAVYTKPVFTEWFNILPKEFTTSPSQDDFADPDVIANLMRYCHIVKFSEGTFFFNQTINITGDDAVLAIIGAEHGRHRYPKTYFYCVNCDGINISGSAKRIENIEFESNKAGTWNDSTKMYDGAYSAIVASTSFNFHRCAVVDFGYGIKMTSGDPVSLIVRFSEFRRCMNDAIHLKPRTLNNCIIESNYFVSNGKNGGVNGEQSTETYSGHGINMNQGNGVSIMNNVFEYNAGCGIIFQNLSGGGSNGPIAATIVGNDFEHNKYTQILIARVNANDNILIKGNFYTDAITAQDPLPSNALPQRTVCYRADPHRPTYFDNISMERFTYDYYSRCVGDTRKTLAYNYLSCFQWDIDDDNVVGVSTDATWNKLLSTWRVPKNGFYRIVVTAKVSSGSARIYGLCLKRNGSNIGTVKHPVVNTTSYADYTSFFVELNAGDIVSISSDSYIDQRSPEGNTLYIKDIQLEEAKTYGTTGERPDFEVLTGVGLGFTYFNSSTSKLQAFTDSGWKDVNFEE